MLRWTKSIRLSSGMPLIMVLTLILVGCSGGGGQDQESSETSPESMELAGSAPSSDTQAFPDFRGSGSSDPEANFLTGIDEWNEVIRISPNDPSAYIARGLAYHDNNDPTLAVFDFNEAIRLDPQLARAYYYQGLTYRDMGQLEEALQAFTEAIRINPEYAAAYASRMLVYAMLDKDSAADADFLTGFELGVDAETLTIAVEEARSENETPR